VDSNSILVKLSAYSIIALQFLERQHKPMSLMEMCELIPFSIPDDEWDIDCDSLRSAIKLLTAQYLIVVSAAGRGSCRMYEITATGQDFLANYRSCLNTCGVPWQQLAEVSHVA
jgi:predicted MarR family transcription regulator